MKKIIFFTLFISLLIPTYSRTIDTHPLNLISVATASYIVYPYINACLSRNNASVFFKACLNRDIKKIKLLTAFGADVNVKDKYGDTPLHWAVEEGHKDIAELLINKDANVNVKGEYGNTPLHLAAEQGPLDIVQLLVEGGANVNIQNNWGNTPLHKAAYEIHQNIAKLLIDSNANIEAAYEIHQNITKLLTATPSLVLQLEQDEDKADRKYKKVKYKLDLNDLKPKEKALLKEWFNREPREPMFDLLMSKNDDKSNNKNSVPFLCLELIADKLFETPFENSIELHNVKAFLKQCFINKDVKINENKLLYPGAQCFIEALYKNHLSRLKLYINIKNNEKKTAIEIANNEDIKKHLEDIQKANIYENLEDELKEINLEQLYKNSLQVDIN